MTHRVSASLGMDLSLDVLTQAFARIGRCHSLHQVQAAVDNYIRDYNNRRYQWERKKMAPVEYRNHLLAG